MHARGGGGRRGAAGGIDAGPLRGRSRPWSTRACCSSSRTAGSLRFGMLETIQEYGADSLTAAGEEPAVRRAHAAHYLALAESRGAAPARARAGPPGSTCSRATRQSAGGAALAPRRRPARGRASARVLAGAVLVRARPPRGGAPLARGGAGTGRADPVERARASPDRSDARLYVGDLDRAEALAGEGARDLARAGGRARDRRARSRRSGSPRARGAATTRAAARTRRASRSCGVSASARSSPRYSVG